MRDWTALETAAAVRAGEVTVREVTQAALERAMELDPVVAAFVTLTPERALDEAAAVDARHPSGPLHGVPTALKDFVDVAGVPTRWGSAVLAGNVAQVDDHTTVALREAGLVSLGKTNVPELGLTCFTEPAAGRTTCNPWDVRLTAAGSSGGAAAAVAARIIPVAQASDSGGSVRSPASVCGLVGVKTSRGRVSFGPTAADGFGLSVRGPLARTVADAAALLDVLGRRFPTDLLWPPGTSHLEALGQPVPALRIALYDVPPTGEAVDPTCRAAVRTVAELLTAAGHVVEEVGPPAGPSFVDAFVPVFAGLAAAVPLPPEAEALLEPFTRDLRALARTSTPLPQALTLLTNEARRAVAATQDHDLVLSPTLGMLPVEHGALRADDVTTCLERMALFSAFTALDNATGRPAVNVPVVWTDDGLPVGVQLVSSWGREDLLLQVAQQLEQAAPWADRLPAVLA